MAATIDTNPYQTPTAGSEIPKVTQKRRSKAWWIVLGFAVGASIPVFFGSHGLHQESIYYASLPPGQAASQWGPEVPGSHRGNHP